MIEGEVAELALPLITCETSEADAERIFSMQRHIAGLHGARFRLPLMEARLREWVSQPTWVRIATAAMGEGEELDDSDSESSTPQPMKRNTFKGVKVDRHDKNRWKDVKMRMGILLDNKSSENRKFSQSLRRQQRGAQAAIPERARSCCPRRESNRSGHMI
jgi:hypothetical protein